MSVFGQNTFPSSGNVGIGTTNPGAPLTVNGTTAATSFFLNPPSGVGAGQFTNGNGDAANFSTVDNEIDSWWGLGIKAMCCSNYSGYGIVFDARSGSIYTQGNVGIGTTSPASKLDVAGSVKLSGSILFGDGSTQSTAWSPSVPLQIATGSISGNYQVVNGFTLLPTGGSAFGENGTSIYLGSMTNHGPAVVAGIWSALGSGGDGGVNYDGALVMGTTTQGNALPSERARIDRLGNFGIGTTTPGAKLDVAGNIKLSGGGASITFPDGTIQSTAWNGTLGGGDYAESVDVSGDRKRYEPGDVLVIDRETEGKFLKSAEPYSTSVMGIYSTKPGLTGRRQVSAKSPDEVPMAMMGIVPTKVSAENGPIRSGDLLVTSSTPGFAMKGTDRSRMLGALIGKALGHLESGTGIIEVGVTLQ